MWGHNGVWYREEWRSYNAISHHHVQTALLYFSSLVKTIMFSSPQLYRSLQSGWLIHQPLVHSLQCSSPSAKRATGFGGVLRKSPCLEAFKAVWGISWASPASVLPASSWPCCQTVCPSPSQYLLVCGFAKGMLPPGSFGKCLAGDEPPHAMLVAVRWKSGLLRSHRVKSLFGFVSFVLAWGVLLY